MADSAEIYFGNNRKPIRLPDEEAIEAESVTDIAGMIDAAAAAVQAADRHRAYLLAASVD